MSQLQNNELNKRLNAYFQTIYASRISKPANTLQYHDIAKVFRDAVVKDATKKKSKLVTGAIFDELQCQIYAVWWDSSPIVAQAIIALYKNTNEILWLDNDENDRDLIEFIKREELGNLLPQQKDKFVEVLITIRGERFIGKILLLDEIDDIPKWRSRLQEIERIDEEHQEHWLATRQHLEKIAPKIQSPFVNELGEQKIQLEFFIWTQWYGHIIHYVLEFDNSELISFSESTICEQIGDHTIPR